MRIQHLIACSLLRKPFLKVSNYALKLSEMHKIDFFERLMQTRQVSPTTIVTDL